MAGKTDLVDQIAKATGAPRTQVSKMLDATLDAIEALLAQGESVTLPGFGTFKVAATQERQGRNPSTGAALTIPAGKRVSFSAGTRLGASVRGK